MFGKYTIHKRIGRGGMGEVYLASLVGELGFEKRLVIKTILPEHAAKPMFVEMFAAEAKTAVSLTHGNVVPIYELGRAEDTLYIVMGHVDGPSLERMLQAYCARGEPPPVGLALLIARQVLTGLAYAHTKELGRPAVVHRDISPRNVLVDRSGQVRIVDFGIAVAANVESAIRGGSTGYMAPEQARAELADPRADVFSAACVFYELLTLRKAFPKKGVWSAPDTAGLPPELTDLFVAALCLDPHERPADASVFITRLGPAIAKYAAIATDTALAAHLRELFPKGWEHADLNANGDELTPVTNIEPKTFATRLTGISSVAPSQESDSPAAAGDGTPAKRQPVSRLPWGTVRSATILLALAGGAAGLIAMLPSDATRRGEPTQEGAGAPPAPPLAASHAAGQDASPDAATRRAPAPLPEPDPRPAPVEPQPTWLTLDIVPGDASVTVGGVPLGGATPYRIPVPQQGEASVRVHRAGFVDRVFSVQAGQPGTREAVQLIREQPKGRGKLRVLSTAVSWAQVSVDGKARGTTPTQPLDLTAGPHRVVVRCVPDVCPRARTLLDKTITVRASETAEVNAQ